MDKLWSALILTGGTSKRFGSDKSEAIFMRALLNLFAVLVIAYA